MSDEAESTPGARRPISEDMPALLSAISEGASLRSACQAAGLDVPSTHRFINADDGLSQQYACAREARAEVYAEEGLAVTRAATLGEEFEGKKIDVAASRVYLDAIKWATARMAPKTAPVQRIDLTSRTRQMTDAEIAAEIAAMEFAAIDDA